MVRPGWMIAALCVGVPALAQEAPTPPNYEDDIAPIMAGYCIDCHRGSRAKNGFDAGSLDTIFEGGSSGAAIEPGNASGSLLYQLVAHEREPFMPYEDEPLPPELVEKIRAWIDAGAPRDAASPTRAPGPAAVPVSAPPPPATAGAAVMPGSLGIESFWWSERGPTVNALVASPGAPLFAVGGHGQVVLYHAESLALLGVLAFPEGDVETLRFSRSGALLLAGGGMGSTSGRAVAWSVETGERVLEIGDEPDVVLGADITSDHRAVALGGPDRLVHAYSTETRERLFEIADHTDWVTCVAYSPDDVLLATADRVGAVFVWEADTGRLFHSLPPARSRVTSLAWRADSMVLAVASEDESVRLFEMENGSQVRSWNAHGGVLAMEWLPGGRLLSAGRDRHARVWDAAGTQQIAIGPLSDLATAVAATVDGRRFAVASLDGLVTVSDAAGASVGTMTACPPTGAERRAVEAAARLASLQTESERLAAEFTGAESALAESGDQASRLSAEAEAARAAAGAALAELDSRRAESERATALAAPLREGLRERAEAVEALTGTIEAARSRAAIAREQMAAAGRDLIQAQLEGLPEGQTMETLTRLLDGATASAKLAAQELASTEIEHERLSTALAEWSRAAAPGIAAADVAAERLREAASSSEAADAAADRAEAADAEARARASAAREAFERAELALRESRESLAAARELAEAAESAWVRTRAAIEAAGGRVPAEDADAANEPGAG